MAEHLGFLRAVIDAPDDDVPRLVYADWLDEQGEHERAEWIRVQDELSRHHPDYAPPALAEREAHLHHAARRQMLAPFLALGFDIHCGRYDNGGPRGLGFRVRRGFVEGIEVWGTAAARRFAERAEEVFALAPLLHLRFRSGIERGHTPDNEVLFEPIELPALRTLLARPELRRLRSLDLCDHGLRDEDGWALLASPNLQPPTRLFVAGNGFGQIGELGAAVRAGLRARFGAEALTGQNHPFWDEPE
jgi:uncharacterized protein (TIGR02996 family)